MLSKSAEVLKGYGILRSVQCVGSVIVLFRCNDRSPSNTTYNVSVSEKQSVCTTTTKKENSSEEKSFRGYPYRGLSR